MFAPIFEKEIKDTRLRAVTVSCSILMSLYVLLCLDDIGHPRVASWFYANLWYNLYMNASAPLGRVLPPLQPILGLGIILAMLLQVTLVVSAPVMLYKGAGDAVPWLCIIFAIKVAGFVRVFISE